MWGRAAVASALGAGAVTAVSCLDPTEVTLVLTTDQPCDTRYRGTQIFVGSISEVVSHAGTPSAQTEACAATNGSATSSIGNLVLVPSGDKRAHFAVEVVMGVSRPVEQCTEGPRAY